MPAKKSETRKEREKIKRISYRFIVIPDKDPDIVEKLSSVRPKANYIKQLIRKDIGSGFEEEPVVPQIPKRSPDEQKAEREIFRENFDHLLESTKTTMKDLAENIHAHRITVSSWRAGETYPRAKQMQKICEFFGISRSEIHEKDFSLKYMEDQMQKRFNALSFEGKRQLMEVADMLKEIYPNHT